MGAPGGVPARPAEPPARGAPDASGRAVPGPALSQRAGEVRRRPCPPARGVRPAAARPMIRRGGLAACACLVLLASPAAASPRQESIFMDDAKLVYSPPDEVDRSLATIKELGADRVRITILWHLVDPAKAETWARYDTAITLAKQHGLEVMLSLASIASAQPTPAQFGEFARMVGERYSGRGQPGGPPPQPA